MSAYVEHEFKRAFIIDEEKIRKIADILVSRLPKHDPGLKPQFKVFRGDSYSYITESVDDVVAEDNSDWRRINRLEVLSSNKEILDLNLEFSPKGIKLKIEGEKRDEVFLLFSDLKEYINNEVTTRRKFDEASFLRTFVLVMRIKSRKRARAWPRS